MSKERTLNPNKQADFTPSLSDYKPLEPFRYWCYKVLPLVYDDSLSYYELLCKVVNYLNTTMEDVENMHQDVTNLYNAYVQLQGYVNNYFDNLDVQEEINNKLDVMASDGTLANIFGDYIVPIYNAKKLGMSSALTDNSDVFNNIINNSNINMLFIPKGTYKFNKYININRPITIIGESINDVILLFDGEQMTLGSRIVLNDTYNYNKCFINTMPPSNSYIQNVSINNLTIRSTVSSVGCIDSTLCVNFKMSNCIIRSQGPGTFNIYNYYGWNMDLYRCQFYNAIRITNHSAFKIHECSGNGSFLIYNCLYGFISNSNSDNAEYYTFRIDNSNVYIVNFGVETYDTLFQLTNNANVRIVGGTLETHSSSGISSYRNTINIDKSSSLTMEKCKLYFHNYAPETSQYFENINVIGKFIYKDCDFSEWFNIKNIYLTTDGTLINDKVEITPSSIKLINVKSNTIPITNYSNIGGKIEGVSFNGWFDIQIMKYGTNVYYHTVNDNVYNTDNNADPVQINVDLNNITFDNEYTINGLLNGTISSSYILPEIYQ